MTPTDVMDELSSLRQELRDIESLFDTLGYFPQCLLSTKQHLIRLEENINELHRLRGVLRLCRHSLVQVIASAKNNHEVIRNVADGLSDWEIGRAIQNTLMRDHTGQTNDRY